MDALGFSSFLERALLKKIQEYEETLLTVSYANFAEGSRLAGVRQALKGIHDSLPTMLKEFETRFEEMK